MAQATGSYDERLLNVAPAATKEQRQEGYDPDLLASPRSRSVHRSQPSTPKDAASPVPVPLRTDSDIEQGQSVSHNGSHAFSPRDGKVVKEKTTTPPSRKIPFWRTTRGMIVIAILVIVIIAVIIGGAVGGTRHKNKSKSELKGSASSSADSQATGGVASGGSAIEKSPPTTTATGIPTIAVPTNLLSSTAASSQPTAAAGTSPQVPPSRQAEQQQTGPDPVLQVAEQERDLGEPLGNILS